MLIVPSATARKHYLLLCWKSSSPPPTPPPPLLIYLCLKEIQQTSCEILNQVRAVEAANCLGGCLFVYGNYVNLLESVVVLVLIEVKMLHAGLKYLKTPSVMWEESLVQCWEAKLDKIFWTLSFKMWEPP